MSVHRRDDLPGEGLGVVDHKGVAVLRPAADLTRARADQSVGLWRYIHKKCFQMFDEDMLTLRRKIA